MPRVFWVNPRHRLVILLAMLTVAAFILLLGQPYFTNASKPRFGDPMLASSSPAMCRMSTGSWAMLRVPTAK